MESHLIDRQGEDDFYGRQMEVCLGVFLRPEVKFESFQALLDQIHIDIEDSRFLMARAEETETNVYSKMKTIVSDGLEHLHPEGDIFSGFVDLSQLHNEKS